MARILLAEADAAIRQALVFALVDRGHEVQAARDRHTALSQLGVAVPDLVVVGLTTPPDDGFEVLARLTEPGVGDLTRVIVLTATGSEQDVARAFELGADAHLAKPFDPGDLVAQVDELLALPNEELKSRRQRELDTSRLLSQLESILGDG